MYLNPFVTANHQSVLLNINQIIIILGPPPAVAYPFILDVEGYPNQLINLFVVLVSIPQISAINKLFILKMTGIVLA